MTESKLRITIIGSAINGRGTRGARYRLLATELVRQGHAVRFIDVAPNESLRPDRHGLLEVMPCGDRAALRSCEATIRDADLVMVSSGLPDGRSVGNWVLRTARGVTAFHDFTPGCTLELVRHDRCAYLSSRQLSKYALYLGSAIDEACGALATECGAPCARSFPAAVDPNFYYPVAGVEMTRDLAFVGRWRRDREAPLERLIVRPARIWTGGRFMVVGGDYPGSKRWPANVERFAKAPPPVRRRLLNETRFVLDIQCSGSRMLEAAACGVPVIGTGGAGAFPSGLIARSTRDVLAIIVDLPEGERRRLGDLARATVLAQHTVARRVQELERYVLEARGMLTAA